MMAQLHAFDSHLNVVMAEVEETVTTHVMDDETGELIVRSVKRQLPMVYVRGDAVILIAPPLRQ